MDRQNGFLRQGIPGFSDENADTASPRDRIGKELRDRLFAEQDGIFQRGTLTSPQSVPASTHRQAPGVTRRHLLRQIQNYSVALAQATMHLDMHPDDPSVLRYYDTYRRLLGDTVRAYESRFGTLTALPLEDS